MYTSRTDDPLYHDTDYDLAGLYIEGEHQRCRVCESIIYQHDTLCEACQREESDAENRFGALEEQMTAAMTLEYLEWMDCHKLASMVEHAEFMEKLIGGAK